MANLVHGYHRICLVEYVIDAKRECFETLASAVRL